MSDSQSSRSPVESNPPSLKSYACVSCKKRKVKCDRNDPCLHCVKAQVQCDFRDPLPPRRQKKPQPETLLLARLKKYEDIMRKSGIDPAIVHGCGGDTGEAYGINPASRFEGFERPAANEHSSDKNRTLTGQFISRGGRSIYLDRFVGLSQSVG